MLSAAFVFQYSVFVGIAGQAFPPEHFRGIMVCTMNAFERLAAKRALLQSSIVSTWAVFKAAVAELVDSYNAIPEGQTFPARIARSDDTLIIVSSDRGIAADHYHNLAVSVSVQLREENYLIEVAAEEWTIDPISRQKKQVDEFLSCNLGLDGDPETNETWLGFQGKKFTPFDAAEHVLMQALLRKPQVLYKVAHMSRIA